MLPLGAPAAARAVCAKGTVSAVVANAAFRKMLRRVGFVFSIASSRVAGVPSPPAGGSPHLCARSELCSQCSAAMHECPLISSKARFGLLVALAAALGSCRGYDQVPGQEAAWRAVAPELPGMSAARLRQCAGPPWNEAGTPSGAQTMVYRYADLKNYCEVTLRLDRGRVRSVAARYSAPEFLWLRPGYNYCGQIFEACLRPVPGGGPPLQPAAARSAALAP
jgi:hypothetical protein